MFDARTLSRLEKVIDLQMWAFGCDARRAEGNLFAARGMRCTPPGPHERVSSTWSEAWNDSTVELSSRGLEVHLGGRSLRLQRGPVGPQLREAPVELLPVLAAWVLEWERWVAERCGANWRDETLRQRQRPAPWNADALRSEWSALTT
jgi:hypothetical protein